MKTAGLQGVFTSGRRRSALVLMCFCILVPVLLFSTVSLVMAHGTAGAVVDKRTVCVLFTYDDGEPMSYGKVTVSAPDSELPFQSGATDRNGIACFAPDRVGQWRISTNDGMGHLQKLSIPVVDEEDGQIAAIAAQQEMNSGRERTSGIIAGLGTILGVAGLISLFRSRSRKSPTESKRQP